MKQTASAFSAAKFKVKAVLIDLDGTLIDTAPEIARAVNAMLLVCDLPTLPANKVQSFIGDGAQALIKRSLTEAYGLVPDEALFQKAYTVFFAEYAKVLTESRPYPNAEASLKQLKQSGFPLACVTNKPATFTVPLLKATKLFDYFNVVVSGDTLLKKKPDPDQILYVCQAFGVEPWEVLLIGDSNTDILAAKNAGCYVFAVPYGYNQGKVIDELSIDMMIEDLAEAFNYIKL